MLVGFLGLDSHLLGLLLVPNELVLVGLLLVLLLLCACQAGLHLFMLSSQLLLLKPPRFALLNKFLDACLQLILHA